MMKRTAIAIALLALVGVAAGPVPAEAAVSDAVIIALNSIEIDRETNITGDVVVNETNPAANHAPSGNDLHIDKTSVAGDLYAESMQLDIGVTAGDLFVDFLTDQGATYGTVSDYVPPVFQPLPTFRPAVPGSGAGANCDPGADCLIAAGDTTLPPGPYGAITLAPGATLILEGGGYDVASVQPVPGKGSRKIRFDGVTQLRVAGRFDLESDARIEAGAGLSGQDLVVYVGGTNVDPDDPNSRPAAASLGKNSIAEANFYVEAGTFELKRQSSLTGAIIAFDVSIDRQSTLVLDSAFNLAPVADAQTVFTLGVDPIDITLTGSDPDGDPLTFSIVSDPTAGTVTAPIQITPTSAQVTYDADAEGEPDQFVFQVDDGKGGTDVAFVDINPSDTTPPPGPGVVVAKSQTVETTKNTAKVITLEGASPVGVALSFSILSGPSHGTLGPLVVLDNHDAEVTYTPDPDFVCGPLESTCDAFDFEVRGDINGDTDTDDPGESDTATVSISIADTTPAQPPVAQPQSVTTGVGNAIEINLANPIGADNPANEGGRSSTCGDGVLDVGEECDDGNAINGDGCSDQCINE